MVAAKKDRESRVLQGKTKKKQDLTNPHPTTMLEEGELPPSSPSTSSQESQKRKKDGTFIQPLKGRRKQGGL